MAFVWNLVLTRECTVLIWLRGWPGMYAENFVRGGGKFIGQLLWFNTTVYLLCRGPKYHWSSMTPDPGPHAKRDRPKSHGIFFHLEGRKGNCQGKWMDTPPYFKPNTQTNRISVRGELAATRFIVCNFTLPSPWPWVIGGLNDCKATLRWAKVVVFFLVLELLAREKEHGGSACSVQLNLFFYLGHLSVQCSPHVLPETHWKNTPAQTKLPIPYR